MVPKTAVLLLSVAHEVNSTSCGRELPSSRAMVARASRRASAGPAAGSYMELGLKYSVVRYGSIARRTSGAIRVVALLSM
jgi:hypothetical protein